MAVYIGSLPMIFTFFLCFSANSLIVAGTTNELVEKVCKSTKVIDFCRAVIYSDPLAKTAGRHELVGIVFGHAYENTRIATEQIESWIKSSRLGPKDATLIGMNKCLRFYRSATQTLSIALYTYDGLDKAAAEAAGYARNCGASFKLPPAIVSKKNQDLINYSSVCSAVAQLFKP